MVTHDRAARSIPGFGIEYLVSKVGWSGIVSPTSLIVTWYIENGRHIGTGG